MPKTKPEKPKRDHAQEITAKILAQMEQGVIPWVRPWGKINGGRDSRPRNALTGAYYTGGNLVILMTALAAGDYTSNRWLTFNQAVELGGHVRKGERSVATYRAISFDMNKNKKDDSGDDLDPEFRTSKLWYPLFNVEQCEGLPAEIASPPIPRENRVEAAETFIAATGAKITFGGLRASYNRSKDRILMPQFRAFKSADDYYCTTFHELAHWTGHVTRLDRAYCQRFGDYRYAFEELVAELASAFLCAEFGFDVLTSNVAYLQEWASMMECHNGAILSASALAQRAVEFLRNSAAEMQRAA